MVPLISTLAALALLGGCSGAPLSVQPAVPPGAIAAQSNGAANPAAWDAARQRLRGTPSPAVPATWMAAEAKQQDLVYISDFAANAVYVFTYPYGKLVGSIGTVDPTGECADAAGNVWITSEYAQVANEFAHGGMAPINTISIPFHMPVGCAVDPVSGSIAIDSFCQVNGAHQCDGDGSVYVYPSPSQQPVIYSVSSLNVYFCGYDAHGNLFVDSDIDGRPTFRLSELPKGASTFSVVYLDRHMYFPGGVQWDGKYLAVGDQEEVGDWLTSTIHQVRFNKKGSGTVVSSTKLPGSGDVVQFWIQGSKVVAPSVGIAYPSAVGLYPYPAGGPPAMIGSAYNEPTGSAVSLAQKTHGTAL
jgi:hypothetical protein